MLKLPPPTSMLSSARVANAGALKSRLYSRALSPVMRWPKLRKLSLCFGSRNLTDTSAPWLEEALAVTRRRYDLPATNVAAGN